MPQLFDLFLHLDKYLGQVIAAFGAGTYLILFVIVFLETGLVVTPFLPGDSLIFAAGAFAAIGDLLYWPLAALFLTAAIIGDTVNYWIGARIGPRFFASEKIKWLNEKHLREAEAFYAKHGAKTIIIARFVPIVRTFAPFVAGIGKMRYRTFIIYNIVGALLWVFLFLTAGYRFGAIPAVQERFHYVILGIVVVSLLPGIMRIARRVGRGRLNKNTDLTD